MSYSNGAAKTCYCRKCAKCFHPLGIMRHIAMHRDRGEDITVTFTHGDTYNYHFRKEPAPSVDFGKDDRSRETYKEECERLGYDTSFL